MIPARASKLIPAIIFFRSICLFNDKTNNQREIRRIDIYELRYNEKYLEIFEKILKKYKRKHKNQLVKMKEIEYKGILLAKIII